MSDVHADRTDALSLVELLDDGLFTDGDWVESKDQDPHGKVRLIQLADVGDGVFRDRSSRFLTMEKAKELRCTFLEPGDVLVARMPEPLGRACIFPGVKQPAVTVVDVCILRPNPGRARPDWLVNAINAPHFRSAMAEFVRGTTRQRVSRRNLGKLTLPVPHVDAQATLAIAVDQIEARRRSVARRVAAVRAVVERFSSAVLAAACSGRLTADWREDHPDATSEELLAWITEVRRTSTKRRQGAENGHGLTSAAQLALLPDTWSLVRLGDILDVGTGATPLRKNRAYYDGGTTPWVTSGAVNAGTITAPTELITPLALAETNVKLFPPGTLLVAMYGEGQTRGRVAELAIEAGTNQAVAAVLFGEETESLQPFLRLFFEDSYQRVRALSIGGVQPNLNLGMIKDTLIPLPSPGEQQEVLRRANAMLATADRIGAHVERAATTLGRVYTASLAKAFRGELAPTETALAADLGRDFQSATELTVGLTGRRSTLD